MDDDIATFLAFTSTEDTAVAARFLDISGGNVEYAVQLFMESGTQPSAAHQDEELAQRLQNEAYEDTSVRAADANVHRHETLLDSFGGFSPMHQMNSAAAIFGLGRVGVFNQRFQDDDEIDEDEDRYYNDDSDDEPQIVELDLDSEDLMEVDALGEPLRSNRHTRTQQGRLSELLLTRKRLAELFKPPFDLIQRLSLDGAKVVGREQRKWILVNIQDQSEFQCQVLNRDFWSNASVKHVVKENFIFLQYQNDSPHGQSYTNFYNVDGFPHISILDPMTGERVYKWAEGVVPAVDSWVADVELFLEKYSLHPGSTNPAVKNEARLDPDAMTEEQQIEYAMKQSLGNAAQKPEAAPPATDGPSNDPQNDLQNDDPYQAIKAVPHQEPTAAPSTRIQFRFPNGKRLIHKFDPENETVRRIYEWLKHELQESEGDMAALRDDGFTLSCAGKPKLIDCLNQKIGEAGLANASVLVERM